MIPDTSLLAGLNRAQRQAASHVSGPLLVLAGAGTGKTKVLTHRIANLLSRGVKPNNILALTFTRKAGDEMQERVANLVGAASKQMRISTFHSLGLSILREHYASVGLPKRFGIANAKTRLAIANQLLTEFLNPDMDAEAFLRDISDEKNKSHPGNDFLSDEVRRYDELLRDRGEIDFDDMVSLALRALQTSTRIRDSYRGRYRYLLVDEFQDTNETQFQILMELLPAKQNLFVVGDDDQSIYGFRGAARQLILDFGKHFPKARNVMLTHNYRCSREVITLANAVIAGSASRYPKTLQAALGTSGPVQLKQVADDLRELGFIADHVTDLHQNDQIPFSDMGVLVRLNSQLKAVAAALKRRSIPIGRDNAGVNVLTLHSAKGLEFPIVFLPGLEDRVLPHWNAVQSGQSAVEEERRLFYVGLTRAKRRLVITWCNQRDGRPSQPSPFLAGLRKRRLVKYERLKT